MRVIDAEGNQAGVMDTRQAIEMARQVDLDLVEVAPQAEPPVCRIMDFGKYKYDLKKKQHKAKAQRREAEMKEVRIKTPKIGRHDLEIKIGRAREFLSRGDRVQFALRFRGREMAHQNLGREIFVSVKAALADVAKVEQDFRMEGRRLTMVVSSTVDQSKAASKKTSDNASNKPLSEPLSDQLSKALPDLPTETVTETLPEASSEITGAE